jgi:hypothetical protein
MQPAQHVLVRCQQHDARAGEPLGLADLLALMNVRAADCARWSACQRICHDSDDRADPPAVEPMIFLPEKNLVMPADRGCRVHDIGDHGRIDLALYP